MYTMCYMHTEEIKIDKHFRKNLGVYFTDGLGSDGCVAKGLMDRNRPGKATRSSGLAS